MARDYIRIGLTCFTMLGYDALARHVILAYLEEKSFQKYQFGDKEQCLYV